MLKLAFLPYFTMSQQTIYEFPVKKELNPPPPPLPWGTSWAQDKSNRAARSAVFSEN